MLLRPYKIFLVILFVLVGLFLIYPTVNAAGLVPCGRSSGTPEEMRPCTTCDIFALGSRVINFVLFTVVPAVAVLFYLIGGLMILLGGAKPGLVSTGKSFFWNTTTGLFIIFGAWMITNTILKSLVGDQDISNNWFRIECTSVAQQPLPTTRYACNSSNQCVANSSGQYAESTCGGACSPATSPTPTPTPAGSNTPTPTPSGSLTPTPVPSTSVTPAPTPVLISITTASLSDSVVNQNYSQTFQATGGKAPYTWSKIAGNLPPGLILAATGTITGTPTTANAYTFTVKVEDSTTPTKQSATKQLSIKVVAATAGAQCLFSGVNLCEGQSPPGGCANSNCSQYAASINKYAAGAATANMLKSILFNESSCNISAANPAGNSYGLMQMQPSTANMYKTRCNVSENITSSWLTNPANADKNICIAAQYVSAIAQSRCGSSPRNIYAGYNGGTGVNGACGQSTSCASDKNCEGQPVMRWECLYDNTQHTTCNAGYNETRTGVRKVVYCVNNPGF